MGLLNSLKKKKGKVALVNFSSRPIVCDWTKDYNKIKDTLLINQGSSTNFPTSTIERLTENKKAGSVVVIITDGEIQNWEHTLKLFIELCNLDNDVFLFLMGNKTVVTMYFDLRNHKGYVEYVETAFDIRNFVFNEII